MDVHENDQAQHRLLNVHHSSGGFLLPLLLMLGLGGCSGETAGLPNLPVLVFNGRVVSETGAGIESKVTLTQRRHGPSGPCSPDSWAYLRSADTDASGGFRLVHYTDVLEGCYVFRAYLQGDTVPTDSAVLTFEELLDRADTASGDSIVVPIQVVVSQPD